MIQKAGVLLLSLFLIGCVTDSQNLPPPSLVASKIVIVKSEKEMFLLDDTGTAFRNYKIAMGGDPVGPKQCEGDMKTPEGLYAIETRNPESKYHLSLKISYPNEQDVANAESMGLSPGGDIFIHGAPNDAFLDGFFYQFKPAWTEGCIAVRNRDMEELWTLVGDGTPIEILP